MASFNVHEAKTHLSQLLDRVEKGEQIVISRAGRPVARLSPLTTQRRTPGRLKGKLRLADDFDAPLPPEVLAAFEADDKPATRSKARRRP